MGCSTTLPICPRGSTDFKDGVYAVRNLTPGEQGLHLVRTGDAEAIFEVFTPYIIVARINDLDDPNDDAEAAVVTLEAAIPVDVAVSLDRGLNWRSAGEVEAGTRKAVDLTRFVKGTCGYLLKLSASGAEKQAAIRSLAVDTWVQVAPISLPRLKAGENHMTYEAGDRYGLRTIPMLVNPDTSNPKDLEKTSCRHAEGLRSPAGHLSHPRGRDPASGGAGGDEDRLVQHRGDVPNPPGRAGRTDGQSDCLCRRGTARFQGGLPLVGADRGQTTGDTTGTRMSGSISRRR